MATRDEMVFTPREMSEFVAVLAQAMAQRSAVVAATMLIVLDRETEAEAGDP